MLSFKVFDRSASDELLVAYRRATALILDAAVHQAVAGEDSDFANVRESVAGLSARLSSPDAKTPDVLVAAGAASEAVRDYLRQASVSVRARRLELEAVVGMLTATMSEIASASGRSITRLHDIERRLAKSHELYDVRDLRQQMSECLAEVREEAACRKKEAERLTADLKGARNEKAAEKPPDAPRAKPGGEVERERDVIEDTIAQAANADPDLFVAILMIDRLQTTTARFGTEVAAKIAEYCARQTRASLRGARHVMVWKDNACVAFLDGTGGADKVDRNVWHEVQQRRSITLELSGREVILPVTYAKGLAFPIAGRTASSLVASMNAFLAQDAPVVHKTA